MSQQLQWLGVAKVAAKAAAEVVQRFTDGGFRVEQKADGTPVTEADVAAEEAIIRAIQTEFPVDAIFGEETGRQGEASTLWLIDPIDGTKSFVRGYPFFSTQIAVMDSGQLRVGVSSAPHYDQVCWASDAGAYMNDQPLQVSQVERVEDASISLGNIATLARSNSWANLGQVLARANRTRGYGDFLHYHMLAAGQIDAVIESDVNILDVAALTVIVRQAGGTMTQLDGEPIGLESTSVLAAPPRLHATLLEEMNA